MKIWDYSNSTETIWTNFDFGEVEAETIEEAREKAISKMKEDLAVANAVLEGTGLSIEMSFDYIQVSESGVPFLLQE